VKQDSNQTVMFVRHADGKIEYPSVDKIEQADDEEEESAQASG